MKTRSGFVSNSSSSSFIINREHISDFQIDKLEQHEKVCGKYDAWTIQINNDFVIGKTDMDNFDMDEYLEYIVQVNMNHVRWD